ncbi:hypothetical protein HYALB_00003783 [Hymenoscyphus albidus]|uniref:Heterokaryon incompatibility domain-containing protein n=1 Tax=Hymenoscyphus albidus TaxID=595503 RepID=A0A9N9QAC5_9HELO|nr:hypothetical protein HYALB_00003783 [Hymenoscyphus albidus]
MLRFKAVKCLKWKRAAYQWFTRAWCSHEMILDKFDLSTEVEKVQRIRQNKPAEADPLPNYVAQIGHIMDLGAGGNPSLPKGLRECDARCDKISIVLNSVGNALNLRRDREALRMYSSDHECYRQLLTVAIAAGDPSALCCTGRALVIGTRKSWLCEPRTDASGQSTSMPLLLLDEVTLDNSPSSNWIQLPGFFLENQEIPSEDCLTAAVFMTLQCQHLGMGVSPEGSHRRLGAGPEYRYWRYHIDKGDAEFSQFTRTVSAVLHCGLKWMLKTAKLGGFPKGLLEDWKTDATNYFFGGFDIQELKTVQWSSSDVGRHGVESVLRFSIWLMSWGVLAPEVETPIGDIWMPTIYSSEGGGKIIAYSTVAVSHGIGKKFEMRDSELFLPKCLLADGYGSLSRGWNLKPKGFGTSAELVKDLSLDDLQISPREDRIMERKIRLFGDTSLIASHGYGRATSQIRIHGPE